MIIGHEKILYFLNTAVVNKNLAHAYCFIGPSHVGKRKVANYISSKLLNTTEDKLEINSDFYFIERELNKKSGKLNKTISIEQIRNLKNRFSQKSWSNGNQVAIIDGAEFLGQASNSILKILEEPPKKTFLFLLVDDEKEILKTILSRCQKIFFSLVSNNILKSELEKMEVSGERLDQIVKASWGRPGRAINFYNNPDSLKDYLLEIIRWKKLVGAPFYEQLKETDGLFGDKIDTQRDREKLRNILDIWMVEWSLVLKEKELKKDEFKKIVKLIDGLLKAKENLRQNIHPRLLVEQSLLNF